MLKTEVKSYSKFYQQKRGEALFYFDEQLPWISNLNISYNPCDWWEYILALILSALLLYLHPVLFCKETQLAAAVLPHYANDFLMKLVHAAEMTDTQDNSEWRQQRKANNVKLHLTHPVLLKKPLSHFC